MDMNMSLKYFIEIFIIDLNKLNDTYMSSIAINMNIYNGCSKKINFGI